jgi:hypothetical protein
LILPQAVDLFPQPIPLMTIQSVLFVTVILNAQS